MKRISLVFACLALLCWAATAQAGTVTLIDSPYFTTTALTGYATYGSMMDGMKVTAHFAQQGGSTEAFSQTLYWADTGSSSGGVYGITNANQAYWSFSLSGDSFDSTWSLVNMSDFTLLSIDIDAGLGGTVFDVLSDEYYSPGSALGYAIATQYGSDFATATYSGSVAIGDTFYGDLYRYLTIDFGTYGLSTETRVGLRMDTDNLSVFDDITPTEPTPEPSTLALAGLGLVGVVAMRRKLKK